MHFGSFVIGSLFAFGISYILKLTAKIDVVDECRPNVIFTAADASGLKIKGEIKEMNLREGQKVKLTVMPQTASGRPGAIEAGSARWSSSDESVVSVEQDPDNPLSAWARGLDGSNNESVVIEFRADGDQDPGDDQVKEIIGTLPVTCTQGDATTVQISASDPVDDTGDTSSLPANPGLGEGEPATGEGTPPETSTGDTSTQENPETPAEPGDVPATPPTPAEPGPGDTVPPANPPEVPEDGGITGPL